MNQSFTHIFWTRFDKYDNKYDIYVNLDGDPEALFIFNHRFDDKAKAEKMMSKMTNANSVNTKYWTFAL